MKIAVTGDLKNTVIDKLPNGFELNYSNPEIVISFGGDGTLLSSEDKHPGIPKLFVKHKWSCTTCNNHNFKSMFKLLSSKNYKILEYSKLDLFVNGKKELTAMNDISLHYIPPRAVRFSLKINSKLISKEIIGDGFVVSTNFGSSGYFHSITRKNFSQGYGVTLNNPVQKMKPVINKNLTIEANISRGPAIIVADCLDKKIELNEKDTILIKPSKAKTRIIKIGSDLRYKSY